MLAARRYLRGEEMPVSILPRLSTNRYEISPKYERHLTQTKNRLRKANLQLGLIYKNA